MPTKCAACFAAIWLPMILSAAEVPKLTRVESLPVGEGIQVYTMPAEARNPVRNDTDGWVTVIADTLQKKYWWTFHAGGGTRPDYQLATVTEHFSDQYKLARSKNELWIFAPSLASFLVGAVSTPYETEAGIGRQILAEIRAKPGGVRAWEGFDTEVNVRGVLGFDFFLKPLDAAPPKRMRLLSASATDDGWAISVTSGSTQIAHLTLSPAFKILSHRIVPPE